MPLHPKLDAAFQKSQVLKVIIGLSNFNLLDTIKKVQAAELGNATYIDIAANVDILQEVRQISSLPICVSSIDIEELVLCYKAGADIIEIGNFDVFYEKGIAFSENQVLEMTKELITKTPGSTICVTIPHTLNFSTQIRLAQQLEHLGVDLIQTEGISTKANSFNYLDQSICNASAALSGTYVFSKYVSIPIISSSGINSLTAPMAISYGASGVGIGSFLNTFSNSKELSSNIQSIVSSLNDVQLIHPNVVSLPLNYLRVRSNKLYLPENLLSHFSLSRDIYL